MAKLPGPAEVGIGVPSSPGSVVQQAALEPGKSPFGFERYGPVEIAERACGVARGAQAATVEPGSGVARVVGDDAGEGTLGLRIAAEFRQRETEVEAVAGASRLDAQRGLEVECRTGGIARAQPECPAPFQHRPRPGGKVDGAVPVDRGLSPPPQRLECLGPAAEPARLGRVCGDGTIEGIARGGRVVELEQRMAEIDGHQGSLLRREVLPERIGAEAHGALRRLARVPAERQGRGPLRHHLPGKAEGGEHEAHHPPKTRLTHNVHALSLPDESPLPQGADARLLDAHRRRAQGCAAMRALIQSLPDNLRGALWMLLSVTGATGMTIMVRELSPTMHSAMIAFLRSFVGLVFLLPLFTRRDALARLAMKRPGLHLARGVLIALALNTGFYAIWKLPVATATILFFLAPVFSTMLAPLMVGEAVGWRRWSAVGIGLAGALLVLRPDLGGLDLASGAAVASSALFAVSLLIGKIASRDDGSDAVFVSSTLLTVALTLPLALPFWSLPDEGWVWLALLALATASSLRGYADIRAFAIGEASFVGPISFLRLPAVALAGWWLYAERLDALTLAGGAVIAGSTLMIMLREGRARGSATV